MSEKETPPKKKGKGKKIILGLGAMGLLGGGGAGAALYASNAGLIGGGGHGPAEPERPHLVPKDGVSESDAARYWSPTGDKKVDGTKFKATYYPLADHFTSNLRDGSGFIQLGLGVSTYYDERVVENVKLHEMAVRSAVLMALSEQDVLTVSTTRGRDALKTRLRLAINDVLKKKEGFGGIDEVEFTNFVVQ